MKLWTFFYRTPTSCFWIFDSKYPFQLNLVCIGDIGCIGRIGFCPGLWKKELNFRGSHCSCSIKKMFLEISNFKFKFHRKALVLKSLFNRVADQETQTQMFSCGVYKFFKNWSLRTTASKTCVLLNKLHLWLKLVYGVCTIIYTFACQFSLHY